jgi:hypothetical protein
VISVFRNSFRFYKKNITSRHSKNMDLSWFPVYVKVKNFWIPMNNILRHWYKLSSDWIEDIHQKTSGTTKYFVKKHQYILHDKISLINLRTFQFLAALFLGLFTSIAFKHMFLVFQDDTQSSIIVELVMSVVLLASELFVIRYGLVGMLYLRQQLV